LTQQFSRQFLVTAIRRESAIAFGRESAIAFGRESAISVGRKSAPSVRREFDGYAALSVGSGS
jgi:hypothetical protein